MKKLIRLLKNPFGRSKKDSLFDSQTFNRSAAGEKIETALVSPEVKKVNVADAIVMTLKDIPVALEPQDIHSLSASILEAVMVNASRKTYSKGETIIEGRAIVDFRNKNYPIVFTMQASRLLAAIAAYKQGYDQVKTGADIGIYDRELAEITAAHFKSSAWYEVEKFVHQFNTGKMDVHITQITLEEDL